MRPFILGIDESGTGAFAGPFTVGAYMSHCTHTDWIWSLGARDSKALTAAQRVVLCDRLAPCAEIAEVVAVPNNYRHQRAAWRTAVLRAAEHCLGAVERPVVEVEIVIDGSEDRDLGAAFIARWGVVPDFVKKADAHVAQVAAASIYAKTVRSALMAELDRLYPVYGWCDNDGYGTPEHRKAIETHGVCVLHRRVKPLLRYFSAS